MLFWVLFEACIARLHIHRSGKGGLASDNLHCTPSIYNFGKDIRQSWQDKHAQRVPKNNAIGDSIPSVPQGSKPLHLLPKPQKSIMVVGLEINVSKVSSQLRVARPPVEA